MAEQPVNSSRRRRAGLTTLKCGVHIIGKWRIKIVSDTDFALEVAKAARDVLPLHGYQTSSGVAGFRDDDFLAARCRIDRARKTNLRDVTA